MGERTSTTSIHQYLPFLSTRHRHLTFSHSFPNTTFLTSAPHLPILFTHTPIYPFLTQSSSPILTSASHSHHPPHSLPHGHLIHPSLTSHLPPTLAPVHSHLRTYSHHPKPVIFTPTVICVTYTYLSYSFTCPRHPLPIFLTPVTVHITQHM